MTNETISAIDIDGMTQCELVTMVVAEQLVGIPVSTVQDILGPQRITSVPMSSREVAGVLNLRGRIVTAIDLRSRLGMSPIERPTDSMSVVIEHESELYSLLIDEVGEVLSPPADRFERDVVALTPAWREVSFGIYRLDDRLLVQLDVARVFQFERSI